MYARIYHSHSLQISVLTWTERLEDRIPAADRATHSWIPAMGPAAHLLVLLLRGPRQRVAPLPPLAYSTDKEFAYKALNGKEYMQSVRII